MRGTAGAFYNYIRNLIAQQNDPDNSLLVFNNTGKVKAKGMEFEMEWVSDGGYKARASYALQDAINETDHTKLVNSPTHMIKANVTIPVWTDKLFAGIEEQFMSTRRTLLGAETGDVYQTNLTIFSQKIIKNLEFSGSVYNLFNKKYGDPGSGDQTPDIIQQDGREYRLKLTCRF